MKFIAYTVKGLEEVAKKEIVQIASGIEVLEVGTKRVAFQSDDIESLLRLRTVDDIGLLVGGCDGVQVEMLAEQVIDFDLVGARDIVNTIREVNENFSITISKANVKLDAKDLQERIASSIADKYGWTYTKLDHSNFDIRVFIDRDEVYVSVRLTEKPLFHREYKKASTKGALRPTVASAMVNLATQGTNGVVVDNFCGSGTILAEALSLDNEVFGGDINKDSVEICKDTLSNLRYEVGDKVKVLDATSTNWQGTFFDYAISNLPWDEQIEIESITDLYTGALSEYARIMKQSGSICLLVSNAELLVKHAKKFFPDKKIQKFPIGLLGQTPTIVVII